MSKSWADAVGLNDPIAAILDDPIPVDPKPVTRRAIRVRVDRVPARGPADTEPPLTVARVVAYDADEKPVKPDGQYIARCPNGGWWWIGGDHGDLVPVNGWNWGGPNMQSVASWGDATTDDDRGRCGPPLEFTFDGPEPPPGIVRLRPHPYDRNERGPHVARCREGGWLFVEPDGVPSLDKGWQWSSDEPRMGRGRVWTPVYPRVDVSTADQSDSLLGSMIAALPPHGLHRVAFDEDDRDQVWAARPDEDDDEPMIEYHGYEYNAEAS